jgi:hypothetical protein
MPSLKHLMYHGVNIPSSGVFYTSGASLILKQFDGVLDISILVTADIYDKYKKL